MKKFTLIIIWLFALGLSVFAQQAQDEPLNQNPNYSKYLQKIANGTWQTVSDDGRPLGYIPPQTLPNNDYYNLHPANTTRSLPATYDLRNVSGQNYMTAVGDQDISGPCWAFATVASLESSWKKKSIGTFDLSERNLTTCHDYYTGWTICDGGNAQAASGYLTRFDGPTLEANDPYGSPDCETTCGGLETPARYVTGALTITENPAAYKQSIMDHGGVYTSMGWYGASYNSTGYYNPADQTYYYNGAEGTNHGVTIVGWDDNKVVTGGATGGAPSGNGAWLIKNSWGTGFGDGGYFWISYEDTEAAGYVSYWPTSTSYDADAQLYHRDKHPPRSGTGYGNEVGYVLVKYVASADQKLEKVSAWTRRTGFMAIEIYDTKTGNVLSDLLASVSEQTCDFPGYYTYDLSSPVEIAEGEDFYVKVKYTTTGYTFPIPYDTDSPAPVAGNQWIGSTGASWSAKDDKCLSVRVFATPSTDNQTATDPVASSITSTSASISWTGSGAQSYRVKYRLKGDVDFLTKDATASPTTISSLYQDTTYYVSISTEIDDVWGAYTSEVPFNTTHDAAVATRVYVDNITAKTARISWNAIGAQRYQIVYQNITDGDAVKLAYSSGSSITISNLIPLKTYRVWMRSNVTGSWPGEWYGFVEFVPQDDRTPTTVIVSDITGTTARASWDGAGADSYQVVLRNVATGASTYYYTPASYRDFSGLSPGTEYSVVVRAKIDGSWPPSFCEATIFNTIADGRFPGDLAVSNITQTSAKFTWTGAGATLYTINFANLSTGASVYRSLLNGPRTESNLSPGTPYMARIRAYIDGAYTPFSDPIYFETLSGKSLLSDYSGGKDNGFVVFPNPVLEKADVLFASEATGKGEISVFDLQGKKHLGLIVDFLPGNNVYELNMGNLSQGIYIVSMFDGENIQYYKVIKQ